MPHADDPQAGVVERFERLGATCLPAFDPPAWAMIAALVRRAMALSQASGDCLLLKAGARMDALEAAAREATVRAAGLAREVERRGGDAAALLDELDRGRAKQAARMARGALLEPDRARDPHARAWLGRMTREAHSRGARLPPDLARDLRALEEGRPSSPPPELSAALSAALFRQSAAAMRALVTAARAAENVPEPVGPYNGIVLSARTLETLADLSPAYLRVFVQRLEALHALQHLPAHAGVGDPTTKRRSTRASRTSAKAVPKTRPVDKTRRSQGK